MQLQFCDQCGRPLGEGSVARGEAFERDGELVCSACLAASREAEAKRSPEPAAGPAGPLGDYARTVWNCGSCGIPVNALDLIEGRASRVEGRCLCSRCAGGPDEPARPTKTPAPEPSASRRTRPAPARPAATSRATPSLRARVPAGDARKPAGQYVDQAVREQRRPILPIVLLAIVLPLFALSVYFTIASQRRLAELAAGNTGEVADADRRSNRSPRDSEPLAEPPDDNRDDAGGSSQPEPEAEAPSALPEPVMNELVSIEQKLAAPVLEKLASDDPSTVWQGLLDAGSRRLAAATPQVRALLGAEDAFTRTLACRALALLQDQSSLPRLREMEENDPSDEVRTAAHLAAARLSGQAAREIGDLGDDELESLRRRVEEEMTRRSSAPGGGSGND